MLGLEVERKYHIPVMPQEAIDYLNLTPGKTVVDATVGSGGHALEILKRISGGKLIAIDRDKEALNIARERLSAYSGLCEFVHANFADIDTALSNLGVKKVDAVLFDLGVSSLQLDDPERGFSFQQEGPLDMRLDRQSYISAYDLVNNLNEEELAELLWNFGEERWSRRIARLLVRERQTQPVATTQELSQIVRRAIPYTHKHYRINPATRTFQAIRIAVNRELEALQQAIGKAVQLLGINGRICIISFHSLEDRIVKVNFREFAKNGLIRIITPKPLTPAQTEIIANPKSRSSKMRVAERL